jgi:hypothetical protein
MFCIALATRVVQNINTDKHTNLCFSILSNEIEILKHFCEYFEIFSVTLSIIID